MRELVKGSPAEEIITHMLPAGTSGNASGTVAGVIVAVRVNFSLTSTATANLKWVNPESGTVMANVSYVITAPAGTGTIDIGRSTAGTGSASDWVTAGTLGTGAHDDEPMGGVVSKWLAIGPGHSGTNNSIVGQISDTVSSTMGGCFAMIRYYRLG